MVSKRIAAGGGAFALVLALLPVTATAEPKPYADEAAINVAVSHPAAASAPEQPVSARAVPGEPFAARYQLRPDGLLREKWDTLQSDIAREREVIAQCRGNAACPSAARRFNAMVEAARERSGRARIGEINRAVNLAIRPQSDLAQHGVADRWSSPLATLASGRGDCEDYAIAKLALLREAGFAGEDLRFAIVSEKASPLESHAVAAVRLEGRWLVLDNRRLALVDATALGADPLFVLRSDPPSEPDENRDPPAPAFAASGDLQLLI
jgi:predicted transglutaminase-like cysteine proteinase